MSGDAQKPVEPTEEEILARMEAEEEVSRRRNAAVEWEIAAATRPSDHPLPPESNPHTRYLLAKKHLEEERGITREAEDEMSPEEQDAFAAAVDFEVAGGPTRQHPSIANELGEREARISQPPRGMIADILRESGVGDLPENAPTPRVRAALARAFRAGYALDVDGREELRDRLFPIARKHGYRTIDEVAHMISRGW